MCERIAGIHIEGGYFSEPCTLTPFALASPQGKPRYISIIYGKNGSGKTSLAQGFYEIATGNPVNCKSELIDHNGTEITDVNKDRIFVFDENYIRRTISFTDDGLDSVIMLGEQVELDAQKKECELRRDMIIEEIRISAASFSTSYESATNPLSPEYHKNALKENLRQNWSTRESEIKGLRQNAPVREDFIAALFSSDTPISLDDARAEFDNTLHQLKSAQAGERIDARLPKFGENTQQVEEKIISLLSEKISEPILSDREQLIMQIIKESPKNEHLVMQAKDTFSNQAIDKCPFCLQSVSSEHKKGIVDSISKVFDTDAANLHRNALSAIIVAPIQLDLRALKAVNRSLCDDVQTQVDAYNQQVDTAQKYVAQKASSIYTPIVCEPLRLQELQVSLNRSVELLTQAQDEYNKNIDSIIALKAKAAELNRIYAREEVRHIHAQYLQQLADKESSQIALAAKKQELTQINTSIENLNAQKQSIHIAIEIINDYLAYIFFEKNRLQLELSGGKYIVKCRGQHVHLPSLSVGERNVIALCYFLSVLFKDKVKDEIYNEKCLLVLDDPISSFDFDNKIGIYSFLRFVFNKIHTSNQHSRCLVMTHELEATFSLIRVCSDIAVNSKAYELKDKTLIPFEDKKYNEYSFMLRRIFAYASQEVSATEYGESIGNIMRRVLEAYGTFTYKKGIEALSCDVEVLDTISDPNKKAYFNNLMYRLVLNGESHLQERAQGIPDTDFFAYIGDAEKLRTAKEVLVFLHLLNPLHLRAHLKATSQDDVSGMINQIETWESDMFTTQ